MRDSAVHIESQVFMLFIATTSASPERRGLMRDSAVHIESQVFMPFIATTSASPERRGVAAATERL